MTYGLPGNLSYEDYVSLWLNIPRARLQQAYQHSLGRMIDEGHDEVLPEHLADAICLFEGAVPDMAWEIDANRKQADVMRRVF